MEKIRSLIMGAAGRDFHDFNVYFRNNENYDVLAFTATQIPNIEGRLYPTELSGKLYPQGIKIYPESDLTKLIKELKIDQVFLSYSDLPYKTVMNRAAEVLAAGADFRLLSGRQTMLKSSKPIVAICAVRTGCGKSQTSRKVVEYYKNKGLKVVAVRHPMPYGNLAEQAVQRFATYEDLKKHKCTIEEREEYEPYIEQGLVIYAGVDYEKILRQAEKEADVIIWDGGNNDIPFYKPNLYLVVVDPHRAGHEVAYYPGEVNFRLADIIVINKMDSADLNSVQIIEKNIQKFNPHATVIKANSAFTVDDEKIIRGKKVLVVEDGPTLTHGEMKYGVGVVAAKKFGAKELIDPKPFAVGSIKTTFEKYTHVSGLLPAMGYSDEQINSLEQTINKSGAEGIVIGTPIDLTRLIKINIPLTRVNYYLEEIGTPNIKSVLDQAALV